MKIIIYFASILLLFSFTISDTPTRTALSIANQNEIKKFQYRLTTGAMDAIIINMQYGQAEVISTSDKEKLRKADVFQIDLVFSNYPDHIDMKDLNLQRIKTVERLRKDLVTNASIQWKLIRQMACKNEAEAKTLFHGIVIHYRPIQGKETSARDLEYLSNILPDESEIGSETAIRKKLMDTTIFAVFNRQRNWKNMTVVSDLTGSMAPYISEVVIWFKLNEHSKRIKNIVFFNDGDNKTTEQKIIGKTGGIYNTKAENYELIREKALETIRNGGGGDGPENDIEALIATQKLYPNAQEIVLIADNLAPIKDLELIHQLNKPVHIILCGTNFGINPEYLQLAKSTKGSIHTMNEDLQNLYQLNEGQTFKLEGNLFIVTKTGIEIVKLTKT